MNTQAHNIECIYADTAQDGAVRAAREIAQLIESKQAAGEKTVLGMATGSSVLGLYKELIRLHKTEGLSFQQVITFNLDEYYPLQPDHAMSYHRFMKQQLFDHIDLPKEQTFIPLGTVPESDLEGSCQEYEAKIRQFGGIDLQILGIGRNGHIGFNEPGASPDSRTRLVELDPVTRQDAASSFGGLEQVPRHAITTGIATILEAKRILLLAWSKAKAPAIAGVLRGPVTESLPASYLRTHPQVQFVLDREAASEIKQG